MIYTDRYNSGWGVARGVDERGDWLKGVVFIVAVIATLYSLRLLQNYQALRDLCHYQCRPTWQQVRSV